MQYRYKQQNICKFFWKKSKQLEQMGQKQQSMNLKTKIKVIFLGDSSVGKSSVINSLRQQPFRVEHEPTVGIDFFSRILNNQKAQYKLQYWDTAGQERFRSIIPSYIRNSQIGVLIYDVGNRNSFMNIDMWIDAFRDYSAYGAHLIIVANKIDISQRTVTIEEGKEKALTHKLQILQVSAKSKEGLHKIDEVILRILEQKKKQNLTPSQTHIISINKKRQNQNAKVFGSGLKWYQQCCYI